MDNESVNQFMMITGANEGSVATQFLEMAGGNLATAISLFFEHGGSSLLEQSNERPAEASGEQGASDEALAQRLQNETYQNVEDEVRAPDQAVHETLRETHVFPGFYGGIGGACSQLPDNLDDIFDKKRPESIFNQRIDALDDDDDDDDDNSDDSDSNDFDSDNKNNEEIYEYVEEPVVEIDDDGEIREYTKLVKKFRPMTKEQKLAMLFRPPFDIMAKINLDRAKGKAMKKQKWIMINIQESGIFLCQTLNRDLWSSKDVKRLVKKHFVFLQYQYNSRNAQEYNQFYGIDNKESLPHIAILDPVTGERLKQWNGVVPTVEAFLQEVEQFLSSFSLDPSRTNPIVREPTPEVDPSTLTEEQQMEFAIRQSMGLKSESTKTNSEQVKEKEQEVPSTPNETEADPFMTIKPVAHLEPENKPGITTRIQIRLGDGRRIIRRFNATEDTVQTIYEFLKAELTDLQNQRFTLTDHHREDLIDKLDQTIEDAGLKNSSLLLAVEEAEK